MDVLLRGIYSFQWCDSHRRTALEAQLLITGVVAELIDWDFVHGVGSLDGNQRWRSLSSMNRNRTPASNRMRNWF